MRRPIFAAALAALLACLSGTADADYSVVASTSGSYGHSDASSGILGPVPQRIDAATGAYPAGITDFSSAQIAKSETRNYFVFDLSGVSGEVTGATLQLSEPANGFRSQGFPGTEVTSVTYRLRDASQDAASLPMDGSVNEGMAGFSAAFARFNDLGTGASFGAATLSASNDLTTLSITLNAAAIASINAHQGGLLAIGGALDPVSFPNHFGGVNVFNGSDSTGVRQLVLQTRAVPEPGSLALIGIGGVGLIVHARRRRAAVVA